jgi:hypothetical protein
MAREREIKRLPHVKPNYWQRFISWLQSYLPAICGTVEIAAIVAEDIILSAPEAAKANIATEIGIVGLEAGVNDGLDHIAAAGKLEPTDHQTITKYADKTEAVGHEIVDVAKAAAEVATSIALGNMGTSGLETQVVANATIEGLSKALNDGVDAVVAEGEDLAVKFTERYLKRTKGVEFEPPLSPLSNGKDFISAREI